MTRTPEPAHRVVIVGGGFAGLYAAHSMRRTPVEITLVDRRNFHLFQPLLYQVATGGLSPADISAPLRSVLKGQPNVRVLMADVVDLDPDGGRVLLEHGELAYDTLILATGVRHHYFGNDEWAARAPGLKTVEDATRIRARVLAAFERAEHTTDPAGRAALLTFVIVGGGPTGVELAGAIGELAGHTLRREFRSFRSSDTRILLVEGTDRILPAYAPSLSAAARRSLERLGVEVATSTMVSAIDDTTVSLDAQGEVRQVAAGNVLWAAGVQASSLARRLADRTGVPLDRAGRVLVAPDCSVPGRPEILVVGDLSAFLHQGDEALPGVAPVAMQQGRYAARLIRNRLAGAPTRPFRYADKGSLAVIGRAAAVAQIGRFRFSGYPAWLLWLFVHILYLVEFENRLLVLIQWAWSYVTRKRGARLITADSD